MGPPQQAEHRRLGELGGATEAAVMGIEMSYDGFGRGGQQLR